jgi:hypothetical protein
MAELLDREESTCAASLSDFITIPQERTPHEFWRVEILVQHRGKSVRV